MVRGWHKPDDRAGGTGPFTRCVPAHRRYRKAHDPNEGKHHVSFIGVENMPGKDLTDLAYQDSPSSGAARKAGRVSAQEDLAAGRIAFLEVGFPADWCSDCGMDRAFSIRPPVRRKRARALRRNGIP